MTTKAARTTSIVAVLAVIALGAYWYWSPFLAIYWMKSAAELRDAEAFNQYVDYPKLRESLKGQFNARLVDAIGTSSGATDMEKAGAGFGAMLGLAVVDKMVDALVRPEMVMKAMNEARLPNPIPGAKGRGDPGASGGSTQRDVKLTFDRKGVDRLVVYARNSSEPDAATRQQVGFVFDREGFARWRLTEIRLPEAG